MFRTLIFGAGGMLAHDLIAEAPNDVELVTRTSRDLDVTNQDAVATTIATVAPDVVINCAAYTDVDAAEAHHDRAMAVNADAAGFVASALAGQPPHNGASEALLVHFGTDYVFDGSASRPYHEHHPCSPLGVYGASKLAGELKVAKHGHRYLILRTQWLYGVHGRSFPRTMWERATADLPTKVVNDQTGRPTFSVDLARATWRLVTIQREQNTASTQTGVSGHILHVANSGSATWYQVAHHIFERAGNPRLVTPCSTADYPTPAKRPVWSVLDTTRFEGITGHPLPSWENALDRFIDEIEGQT